MRFRSHLVLLFVLYVSAASLEVGCDMVKAPRGRHDPLARADYPQVTALDDLHRYILFADPVVKHDARQPMSITVPVRAAMDQPVRVQYRFEFFDQSGRPLRPRMDWRYMLLPARGQRFMESTSLDIEAEDWRLEVRSAQ